MQYGFVIPTKPGARARSQRAGEFFDFAQIGGQELIRPRWPVSPSFFLQFHRALGLCHKRAILCIDHKTVPSPETFESVAELARGKHYGVGTAETLIGLTRLELTSRPYTRTSDVMTMPPIGHKPGTGKVHWL